MLARGVVLAGLVLATLVAPASADTSLTLSSGSASVSVQGPGDASAVSAVGCSPTASVWAGAISGTKWIGRQSDCSAGAAVGTYTYSVAFDMPSGASNQQLSGSVMADDNVTVQLNGNTIFGNGGGFGSASSFSTTNASQFTTGTNTLTFTVPNSGGQSGLDFQVTVSASNVNVTATSPSVRGNGRVRGDGEDEDSNDEGRSCPAGITTLDQARAYTGWRNHGQFVSCVAHGKHGGVGPSISGSGISVSDAAQSDVGKQNGNGNDEGD